MPDPGPAKPPGRAPAPDESAASGWRVDPAPDGRGADKERRRLIPNRGRLIGIVVALLALNLIVSFVTGLPDPPEQVPYQPFFLEQVEAGNVEEISSRERLDRGGARREPTRTTRRATTSRSSERFKTQVPAFIDRRGLTRLLTEQGVVINAESPDAGRRFG